MAGLSKAHAGVSESMSKVALEESGFQYSLKQIQEAVQVHKAQLKFASSRCDGDVKASLDVLDASLTDWDKRLGEMAWYVSDAAKKRSNLNDLIFKRFAADLQYRFAVQAGVEVAAVQADVEGFLLVNSIDSAVEDWWYTSATRSGIGGAFLSKYYEYERPLAAMRIAIAKGEELRRQVTSVPDSVGTKQALLSKTNSYLSVLTKTETEHVKGGWRAMYEAQKYLAAAYGSSGSAGCRKALGLYSTVNASVSSLASYRLSESAFALVVDACSGGAR
jgi:hypothetical protein